jgi:HEAT repeat protein
MKRRSIAIIIILTVILAICGGVSWWVFDLLSRPLETDYQGKKESQWAKQLSSDDVEDRREAAKALGEIFYKFGVKAATILALLKALDDEDAIVRLHAINSLARVVGGLDETKGQPETAVKKLVHLLQDTNAEVRRAAAKVLPRIGPAASTALDPLAALFNHKDEWTRLYAAQSWWSISGEPGETVPILQAAAQSPNKELRLATIDGLEEIGEQTKSKEVVAILINCLNDNEAEVRKRSVFAIGKAEPAAVEAIPHLEKLRTDDPDASVRDAANHALSWIRSDDE